MTASEAPIENGSRASPSLKQYKELLLDMFAKLGYEFDQNSISNSMPENTQLRKAMEEAFDLGNLTPTLRQAILGPFEVGYHFANTVYQHSPAGVKLYVAIHTAMVTYIDDDAAPDSVSKLKGFCQRFVQHEPQADVHYDLFARLLMNETPKLFGPFATACIVKSSTDLVVSTGVELQYATGYPVTSKQLPGWMRRKTGSSESFAFFVFPDSLFPEHELLGNYLAAVPEIAEWMEFMNDLLSYYKERVVGREDNCYIINNARMLGVTELESLKMTAKRAKVLHDRITAVLFPNKDLLSAWEKVKDGLILWHLREKRYKLRDIF